MVINKESTPPPIIGKAGRYTVFLTPPSTPSPSPKPQSQQQQLKSESPKVQSIVPPTYSSPLAPPPVQPPPQQFEKSAASVRSSSTFGFFWNAVAKVQNAHSSLDGYLAEWFGLDHSKYQWALDDYYENKGMVKGDTKSKDRTSKGQSV